ncbi:insulinase family protein [Nocardioides albidus]|uniref:Insulinase family protein n=1 Tax=Nocardioides albidus TaxID=1517589 RepID=A0A5C4VR53_9ACTN|nr:insulinase family protein [Nocardioides albidus]TNM38414.1 insulinase family protein [Nocardioides albidus]
MTTQHSEVAGIPLLLGPALDGRCAGGLTFRVGYADETLATSGITHLTEHLALHFSDPTKLHSNGITGANTTTFHVSGTLEEVVTFLNEVAAALRDLPLDRLETEKSVLRTEAARRGGPADMLHAWRFGARDYGLASYAELGLHRIGREDVAAWAARWFTRDNAVLWLAADGVPDGLDLALPAGRRHPAPAVEPWLAPGPTHYLGRDGVVAASALIERSTAGRVFVSVLEQALYRELRQVGGYSYSPTASYEPLDRSSAVVYAFADSLPEKQDAVVGGFVDVLAGLRLGPIADDDIVAAVNRLRTMLDHPDVATLRLPADAVDLLLGHDNLTDERARAELDAVDAAAVRAVAEEVHASSLLQVPRRAIDWAGYVEAPDYNDIAVTGTSYRFIEEPEAQVTADATGVSVGTPAGSTGVLWSDAVALTTYPDGARTAIGSDGYQVHVEPNLLAGDTTALVAAIDAGVGSRPEIVVPLPARDPERIPAVSEPPAAEPKKRTEEATGPRWAQIAATVCGALALGSLVFFLWGLIQHFTDDGAASEELTRVLGRGLRALLLGGLSVWFHRIGQGRKPATAPA